MAYSCSLYTFPQLLLFTSFKTVVVVHCSIVFGLFLPGLILPRFRSTLGVSQYISVLPRWNMGSSWRKICFGKPPQPWSSSPLAVSCLSRFSLNCSQLPSRLSWLSMFPRWTHLHTSSWNRCIVPFLSGSSLLGTVSAVHYILHRCAGLAEQVEKPVFKCFVINL